MGSEKQDPHSGMEDPLRQEAPGAREKPRPEGARLFIAVPLSDVQIAGLTDLMDRLKKGAQFTQCRPTWVAPETIHLTLAFLGKRPAEEVPVLAQCLHLAAAGFGPLKLEIKGLGVFPDWRGPRVMWAGLRERTHQLDPLRERLIAKLRSLRVAYDDKPFKPHLTLARFKSLSGTAAFGKVAGAHEGFFMPAQTLDRLVLFSSELNPAGARHTPLHTESLSGGGDE